MVRVIDFINDLWMMGGEPSDFDPWLATANSYTDLPDTGFDVNSRGVRYYLGQLSRAQTAVANWRKRSGHEVRFKRFNKSKVVKCGLGDSTFNFRPVSDFAVSIPLTEFYSDILVADFDIFEGSMFEIGSTKYIVDQVEYDATLNGGSIVFYYFKDAVFDTTAISVEGTLYMNQFKLVDDTTVYSDGFYCPVPPSLIEILKVYDGPSGNRLKRPTNKDSLYDNPGSIGQPEQWYIIGDRIYFDKYIEDMRFFKIEYYVAPTPLVATTLAELIALRFEIPEYFIEPVQIWVEWRQARMQQEWDKAYAIKRDLQEIIESLSTENSLDFMRDESAGFFVQMEETL